MTLSFKEVAEILKLIDASDCEEVVLELEGVKLKVRRGGGRVPDSNDDTQLSAAASTIPVSSEPAPAITTASSQPVLAESEYHQVRAPMVGTYYSRPAPDQPPFVEPGASVEAGDPLCLIEVMKLYTTIEADVSGVVEWIGAEDGQLVEFDQLLFSISPV